MVIGRRFPDWHEINLKPFVVSLSNHKLLSANPPILRQAQDERIHYFCLRLLAMSQSKGQDERIYCLH